MKRSKASYAIAGGLGCAFAVFVIVFVLAPSDRARRAPLADFERDLAVGNVEEVDIDGTTYRYRVRGSSEPRSTTGPKPTLSSIAAMGPHDRDAVRPTVRFVP